MAVRQERRRRKKSPVVAVLQVLFLLLLLFAAIQLGSAVTLDRMVEYVELTRTSEKIPPELDGYRIAFLTDIHGTSPEKLREIVGDINSQPVDLVLLGGDFSGQKSLSDCLEIVASIHADGFFGVEGNHDRADELGQAMEDWEMTLLDNESYRIRPGLTIAGVEDLWNREPDVEQAVAGAGAEDYVILLAHNPDVSMEYSLEGVDLMLSGHTHGGEVTLLGQWGPAMSFVSDYGQRFRTGWCQGADGTDVYVSNGVGCHFLFRSFARPQVILLTLRAA